MKRFDFASWRALGALAALAALLIPGLALAEEGWETNSAGMAGAVAFWALAGLSVVSAAGVAFSRNILYSSFSLLGTFLGVAGLYVFLSADFLAVAQVLIYVGGVLVLILFAVMLTSRIGDVRISNEAVGVFPATLATVVTTGLMLFIAWMTPWRTGAQPLSHQPTAAALGELFLTRYLLPFEIASVVLLATLVGAVVVARKEIKPE